MARVSGATVDEVRAAVDQARAAGSRIEGVDLKRLNRVLEHSPEDMVASFETGIGMAELQRRAGERGQWLPIDAAPAEELDLHTVLAENRNGPRRFGYGTVRDYVLGMRVVLADGGVIACGGKVVKNVAGFDLCKLFIGAKCSLGIIVEATVKLRPVPESEALFEQELSLADLDEWVRQVALSDLEPVICDAHNLGVNNERVQVVLGFAGAREDVDYQATRAVEWGMRPGSLGYEPAFWNGASNSAVHRRSVRPSAIAGAIRALCEGAVRRGEPTPQFVARAGNGIVYSRVEFEGAETGAPPKLMRRVKEAFDPGNLFQEYVA